MRQPLHPGLPRETLASHDRHCYFKQVLELGIFIVASPLGRAAVFALTQFRKKGKATGTYGFRLEYLLPFVKGNEGEVGHPEVLNKKLAGIAVSPVQGMLDGKVGGGAGGEGEAYDARRYGEGMWRLLMCYADHTVVSYELKRKRGEGEAGVGDIVV